MFLAQPDEMFAIDRFHPSGPADCPCTDLLREAVTAGVPLRSDRYVGAMPGSGPSVTRRPSVLDVGALRAVEQVLSDIVERQTRTLAGVGPELDELVDVVRDLMDGGKRLRAAFCLWGAQAVGEDARPAGAGVAQAAAALEMFHLGALVHDDVMDRSELRRGVPTVHRTFATRHTLDDRAGSAEAFGDSVAILVGDLCLTWADDLLDRAVRSATAAGHAASGEAARLVWERMRTQTMAGQYLDLVAQGRRGTSTSDATQVLHFKSAKYTVEHPLLLGGALVGAPAALLDDYAAFGLQVGEAFQLRDDVLGVFGEPGATGKSSLDDVREGKRTMLVAYAEEAAGETQLAVLRRHLGDDGLDDHGLRVVREVLTDTGALARVESRIGELVAQAFELLDRMPVTPQSREALVALTDASVWRSA